MLCIELIIYFIDGTKLHSPTKSLGQSPKHNSKITLSRQSVIVERHIMARWIRHDDAHRMAVFSVDR